MGLVDRHDVEDTYLWRVLTDDVKRSVRSADVHPEDLLTVDGELLLIALAPAGVRILR